MEDNRVPEQLPIDVLKVDKMANEVLELMTNTPTGVITDGDRILADIMEQANFDEFGTTEGLVAIWKQTTDKV